MVPGPKSTLERNFGADARKAPEIHLGYFTRIRGIWALIDQVAALCLQSDCNYQIVNLGAGYDTLYWRLKAAAAGKVYIFVRILRLFALVYFHQGFH